MASNGQAEVRDGRQPPYSMAERGSMPSPCKRWPSATAFGG